MYMYRTARMYTPEYFRYESSQFMLGTRKTIAQDIQKSGKQCELGKPPQLFPIYGWMYKIM